MIRDHIISTKIRSKRLSLFKKSAWTLRAIIEYLLQCSGCEFEPLCTAQLEKESHI